MLDDSFLNAHEDHLKARLGRALRELVTLAKLSVLVIRYEGMTVFLRRAFVMIRLGGVSRIVEPPPDIGEQLSRLSHEYSMVSAPATEQMQKQEFGVNLSGYFTGQFGIAASSRAFANALKLTGVPHVLNNVVDTGHGEKRTIGLAFNRDNPYAVNLIHVHLPTIPYFFQLKGPSYFQGRYNIGIWYWELSRFPIRYMPAFKLYDEVWTTTSFTKENLSKVSPVPITKIRYPLSIDTTLIDKQARKRFGLGKDVCVFLFMFDFNGLAERKNPYSLLNAFRMAFDRKDKSLLVLNCINGRDDRPASAALKKQCSDLNVKIIEKQLSERDYFSLIAASDCYVSLHRAEGLGIPMAEAMYLERPTIATAYGGNMDFMNMNNSLLVRYDLVELERDYGPFEKGSVWAEADVEHAAELMRWVYDHPHEARAMGKKASLSVRQSLDPLLASQEIRTRLEEIRRRLVSLP